jgi:hypothetical protein
LCRSRSRPHRFTTVPRTGAGTHRFTTVPRTGAGTCRHSRKAALARSTAASTWSASSLRVPPITPPEIGVRASYGPVTSAGSTPIEARLVRTSVAMISVDVIVVLVITAPRGGTGWSGVGPAQS